MRNSAPRLYYLRYIAAFLARWFNMKIRVSLVLRFPPKPYKLPSGDTFFVRIGQSGAI